MMTTSWTIFTISSIFFYYELDWRNVKFLPFGFKNVIPLLLNYIRIYCNNLGSILLSHLLCRSFARLYLYDQAVRLIVCRFFLLNFDSFWDLIYLFDGGLLLLELSLDILDLRSNSSSSDIRVSNLIIIFLKCLFSSIKRITCSSEVIFSPQKIIFMLYKIVPYKNIIFFL